ncbi:MAG: collagen-like protein [Deltaproteobacteria bacterium]|jgi:succinate dehydrogenase/fumarate reductase cytochrome b subunit|nr:collagen-like protein [Deltaproteobacteria bacterium]
MAETAAVERRAKGPGEIVEGAAAALCVIVTAAAYLVYILDSDLLMTAEQASDILAGMEMLRQKALFLRDWFYADETFSLRSPLAVAFFGIFTGGSMQWAHRLGVFLELAAEILALTYLMRRIGLRGRPAVLAAALFFGARSYPSGLACGMGFSRDASFLTAMFLALGYCAAASQGIRGRAERILRFAIPAAAFLFGLSSIIAFALLFLPLLLRGLWRAAAGEDAPRPPKGDILGEIAVWNACFLAGYLILVYSVVPRGLGPALLASGESVGLYYAAAANVPHLWGELAEGTPLRFVAGAKAFASLGWLAGMSFAALAALTLWKTPWAVRRAQGPDGDALRALAFCLAAAFLLMAVHLGTDNASVRYLLYLYPFAALLLASLYRRLSSENPGLARLLFWGLAFAVFVNGANNIAQLPRQTGEGKSFATARHAGVILEVLASQGVRRFYGLYWDSYNLEVLADGRVKAGAVDGYMRPFLKNAALRSYAPGPPDERTAFVLSLNPRPWAEPILNLQDPSVLETAEGVIELADPYNPVRVYVFSGNPFTFAAAAGRGPAKPQEGNGGKGGGRQKADESEGTEKSGEAKRPGDGAGPGEPGRPGADAGLGEPGRPGADAGPGEPEKPGEAGTPAEPGRPGEAGTPAEPGRPGDGAGPGEPGGSGDGGAGTDGAEHGYPAASFQEGGGAAAGAARGLAAHGDGPGFSQDPRPGAEADAGDRP